jgi:hypothetical protein
LGVAIHAARRPKEVVGRRRLTSDALAFDAIPCSDSARRLLPALCRSRRRCLRRNQ